MFFGIPNIGKTWWGDPIAGGISSGLSAAGRGLGRGLESVLGLGETKEEREARLYRNWLAQRDKTWAAEAKALPFDQGPIDYPKVGVEAQERYMASKDPGLEYQRGVGVVARVPKKEKKDEESEFDKYMKMQFLSKLIERQKAPSPGYATRAGTARSPVATSIMQTHPGRRQDDLLNYIYGPSYGRRV